MPAVADLALGIAPIAGGMAIGAAAGYLKGPDVRSAIKQDIELLKELPPEQVERRTELQRSIDSRIDDLIAAVNRYRWLRRAAGGPSLVPVSRVSKKRSTASRISPAFLDSYTALRNCAPCGTPWVNHEANCFILPSAPPIFSSTSMAK